MIEGAKIIVIAAADEFFGVGLNGGIPWHLTEDLKRFRSLTLGGTLVMGRKTYESCGRRLDGRELMVISRSLLDLPPGVRQVDSVRQALELHEDTGTKSPLFAIGGTEVWRSALALAGAESVMVLLTRVAGGFNCDTFFPWDFKQYGVKQVYNGPWQLDEKNGLLSKFEIYVDQEF